MWKQPRHKTAGFLLGVWLATVLTAGPAPLSPAEDPILAALLDAAAGKMESYPDFDRWEAITVTTRSRMDKSWEPEKITRIKKNVHVEGQDRQESVLEAFEIEQGVTRDITERMVRTYEERARKEREERASGKASKAGDGDRRAITLTKNDFLPFEPGQRSGYEFRRLEDAVVEGIPACIIETRAKIRKPENIEGTYYFDRETMDILKVDLQPSRNPAFVKEIEMEVEFVRSQGAPAMKRTRLKVHAGFLFKTVRLIVEEEYADFHFLPATP